MCDASRVLECRSLDARAGPPGYGAGRVGQFANYRQDMFQKLRCLTKGEVLAHWLDLSLRLMPMRAKNPRLQRVKETDRDSCRLY